MNIDVNFKQIFATRTFSQQDQQRFAAISGDVNPMHMDAIAARRLIAGRQVVHGVHALLAGLEQWSGAAGAVPGKITCDFVNPICVGDRVDYVASAGISTWCAMVGEMACCHVNVVPGTATPGPRDEPAPEPLAVLEQLDQPLALSPAKYAGRRDAVPLPSISVADEFPRLTAWLGQRRVAAVTLLSYYVGMVCPGMDSVFASLSLGLRDDDSAPTLSFYVRRYDPRYRVFVIAFDGCIRGEIKAFLRAKPQVQPPMSVLLGLVQTGEFVGTNAWVIGGSRGLGEVTAKLIAAGGGDVTITYATGADDAAGVVDAINAAGHGRAKTRRLDLLADPLLEWVKGDDRPDAVFYFATPRIFRKKATIFDAALLGEFLTIYVDKLNALCVALRSLESKTPIRVFHPSTVFLNERPKGMTEYAMAKAAAEILVQDLNASSCTVQLDSQRLPRLATDQTATVFTDNAQQNEDTMLPIIRRLLERRESACGS